MSLKETITNFVEKRKDELFLSLELQGMVEMVNNSGGDVQIRVNEEHLYEVDIVGERINIDDVLFTKEILKVPGEQIDIIFRNSENETIGVISC